MIKILNVTNAVKIGEIVFSEILSTFIFDINLIPDDLSTKYQTSLVLKILKCVTGTFFKQKPDQ